jgi:SpoIID/LytB domain protein
LATTLDGQLAGGPAADRRAVRVTRVGDSSWRLEEGPGCGGPWTDRGTFAAAEVVVTTTDPNPDQRVELVAACENGRHRYYRGAVVASYFAITGQGAAQRTMNRVPVESYLRSVVPSESPSSWGGTNGTAPGQHALLAQAVTARSYALAGDTRYGLADTCDDIFCQVYKGFGTNTAGAVAVFETTNTDLAVAQTAGRVRVNGTTVARTEFSSSTGGHTAGGAFPAVPDDGDDVTANPNHNWSTRVTVAAIEAAFDARHGRDMGALQTLTVTERNGLGADGGRVESIVAGFANGTSTVSGNTFRSMFNLKSDWFTPGSLQADTGFSDTAGHTHEANIDKVAAAGIASGFADGTFRPDSPVTRAQMATFITKGWKLAAAESPFTDTDGDVHEASIGAVAAAGITSGCTSTTYCPTANITRGQMAVFLAEAEGLAPVDGEGGLCDVDGHRYEGDIRAIVAAGIASGNGGCFLPDNPVTRGQMATFIVQALGL